jgi:hypothetical protein
LRWRTFAPAVGKAFPPSYPPQWGDLAPLQLAHWKARRTKLYTLVLHISNN